MSKQWVIFVVLHSSLALVTGCGDPPTRVGDVCQIDDHCWGTEGNFEFACDVTIPGGVCMVQGCTPDDPATEENEDGGSCPDGSRCVVECPLGAKKCPAEQTTNICRRDCDQQSDCGEVIVCRWRYDKVDACISKCTEKEGSCRSECAGDQSCEDDCIEEKNRCDENCEDEKYEECKNEMECTSFWSPLPTAADFPDEKLPEWAKDPPRACILKDRLYQPPKP